MTSGRGVSARADFAAGLAAYKAGDRETARREWLPPANAGDAKAQFCTGCCASPSNREQLSWYRRAAEQGHVRAQLNLGTMYTSDLAHVPLDVDKAAYWFQRAAEQGDRAGQFEFAQLLRMRKNYSETVRWYRPSTGQGYVFAQYRLGMVYQNGRGVPRDYTESGALVRPRNRPKAG